MVLRNAVTVVAAPFLPIAALGLPVSSTAFLPNAPLFSLLPVLLLRRLHFDLLRAVLLLLCVLILLLPLLILLSLGLLLRMLLLLLYQQLDALRVLHQQAKKELLAEGRKHKTMKLYFARFLPSAPFGRFCWLQFYKHRIGSAPRGNCGATVV